MDSSGPCAIARLSHVKDRWPQRTIALVNILSNDEWAAMPFRPNLPSIRQKVLESFGGVGIPQKNRTRVGEGLVAAPVADPDNTGALSETHTVIKIKQNCLIIVVPNKVTL